VLDLFFESLLRADTVFILKISDLFFVKWTSLHNIHMNPFTIRAVFVRRIASFVTVISTASRAYLFAFTVIQELFFSSSSWLNLFSCSTMFFLYFISLFPRFCVILVSLTSFTFLFSVYCNSLKPCQSWLKSSSFQFDFTHAASFITCGLFMWLIIQYQ